MILLPDWLLPKSCGPPPPPPLPPYAAIAGGGRLKLPYSIDKTVAKNVIKPHFGKRKYFLGKKLYSSVLLTISHYIWKEFG